MRRQDRCGLLYLLKEDDSMTLDEIHEGMPVLYIPRDAHGDRTHPDCQWGIVTGKSDTQAFVRYGTDHHSHATLPAFLVPDNHDRGFAWRFPLPPGRSEH